LYGRLLVNQNFDSQDVLINGENRRSIQVLTRAEGRVGFWDTENPSLHEHLEIMHSRTKAVFANMLTTDMRARIGIE
jgi:hypothetical protein